MSEEPTSDGLAGDATIPADAGASATGEPLTAGSADPRTESVEEAATPPPVKKRNFFRRHLALTSLLVIFLLVVGSAGSFVWYLSHELGNVRSFGPVPRLGRSATPPGGTGSGQPMNILVLGSDDGNNVQTVADDLQDGHWTPGLHRSDTIILVHLPADRKSAQIISIPRDSWVKVPTFPGDVGGYAKINAAFSWGGPALAVRTVKELTGLPIDHVAMIDWNGFKGLTDALGGVRVYIPQTVTDDSQHITWQQGWQTLNGERALAYVRTRHGLANGDFGRIERQQNFLRTIMTSMLSTSTFVNPVKLARVVGTISSFVEVDDSWTTGDLRSLAWQDRDLRSSHVQFTTAPFGSYDVVEGQDIVRLDAAKCKQLFYQFNHGDIAPYLAHNPGSALPNDQAVK